MNDPVPQFPVGSTWRSPTDDNLWVYLSENGYLMLHLPGKGHQILKQREGE